VGSLHVVASDRDDTVVTVLPTDESKPADVRAAEETRVELTDGTLTLITPRDWRRYFPFSAGTVSVTVELPAGSSLTGRIAAGPLFAEGRFGAVDVTVTAGDARIEDAGRLDVRVSAGSVVVGRATGPTSIRCTAGNVRVREITAAATIKAPNGPTTVRDVTGTLHVVGAHGDVVIDRVRGTLAAKCASGGIRVDRVEAGSVTLTTSYGSVEVGVPEGTAAWLDVSSQHGAVRNLLRPTGGPVDGDEATAELYVRTGYGDVVVRRPESLTTPAPTES
jgi:hypothetical protein